MQPSARAIAVLLLTIGLGTLHAGAQELAVPASLHSKVAAAATAMTPRLVETRRDIHRHPELGFRETRTAALVAERLTSLGFDEVRTGVGVTGVVGVLKGGRPGKVVAIRADMDALPIPELIASGATYAFDFVQGNPVTFNEPALAEASLPALAGVVGRDRIQSPPPQMGAEDFALYQERIPGLYFFLGVGNTSKKITAMIHTEYFDMDEDALPIGVRAMSMAVLDYLYRP